MIKILLIVLAVILLAKGRKILGCGLTTLALIFILPVKAFAVIALIIGLILIFGG